MPGTFPTAVLSAAIASRQRYGIPASVTLAQWAVESAWGARMSGKNNPFGIKSRPPAPCTACMTREVIRGQTVHETQYFADYPDLAGAFEAHAKLLATGTPYAHARSLLPDAEAFATALTGVYATDPHYGQTLIGIMRQHDLAEYDRQNAVVKSAPVVAPAVPAPPVPSPGALAAARAPALTGWRAILASIRSHFGQAA